MSKYFRLFEREGAEEEHILRRSYPEVPVGGREGARSEFSTYLHLIVCWLELDAMVQFLGEKHALENLLQRNYYTWIYKQVVEDRHAIGEILDKCGLIIHPEKRQERSGITSR